MIEKIKKYLLEKDEKFFYLCVIFIDAFFRFYINIFYRGFEFIFTFIFKYIHLVFTLGKMARYSISYYRKKDSYQMQFTIVTPPYYYFTFGAQHMSPEELVEDDFIAFLYCYLTLLTLNDKYVHFIAVQCANKIKGQEDFKNSFSTGYFIDWRLITSFSGAMAHIKEHILNQNKIYGFEYISSIRIYTKRLTKSEYDKITGRKK